MEIEMITTSYNGVTIIFFGHVFEETKDAVLLSAKIPIVAGGPVKGGEWIRRETIKHREIMGRVTKDPLYPILVKTSEEKSL